MQLMLVVLLASFGLGGATTADDVAALLAFKVRSPGKEKLPWESIPFQTCLVYRNFCNQQKQNILPARHIGALELVTKKVACQMQCIP